MDNIIKLKQPKDGFKIDQAFANDLSKRLKDKQPNIELDIGLVISEAISLFLEKYEVKSNIIV